MRGEYRGDKVRILRLRELPPHARRILFCTAYGSHSPGTTSTCAENTQSNLHYTVKVRNYLRVRGEYGVPPAPEPLPEELPPRARRIPLLASRAASASGTTSAHAENTSRIGIVRQILGNYLRARGEYGETTRKQSRPMELPPRTRRIRQTAGKNGVEVRTTSAHAENTNSNYTTPMSPRNYLRARGEYSERQTERTIIMELPPRTRRIPGRHYRHL